VTTYDDLSEGSRFEILVRVRSCSNASVENRAFEMSVEDTEGSRFRFIVWEKSERGRRHEWEEGAWYLLSGTSVNEWPSGKVLHGTTALEFERVPAPRETNQADVLYMTDSHLGKEVHGFGGRSWPVSPAEGFTEAIDIARRKSVDAVVHGGDLFHNPGGGIEPADVEDCRDALTDLAEHGIPFYFVFGNHERQAGQRVMRRFEDDALAHHLGARYETVGDAPAIYGVDHQAKWDRFVPDFESPPSDLSTMVCLHQSIAPFTTKSNPDGTVEVFLGSTALPVDVVANGHTHKRDEYGRGDTLALAGGATARLGKTRDALQPSVELVHVDDGHLTLQRRLL
jgi:predicted phosphodiesterase